MLSSFISGKLNSFGRIRGWRGDLASGSSVHPFPTSFLPVRENPAVFANFTTRPATGVRLSFFRKAGTTIKAFLLTRLFHERDVLKMCLFGLASCKRVPRQARMGADSGQIIHEICGLNWSQTQNVAVSQCLLLPDRHGSIPGNPFFSKRACNK
jgi:hypothetical protein